MTTDYARPCARLACRTICTHYQRPCPVNGKLILCDACASAGYRWSVTGNLLNTWDRVVEVKQ